MFNQVIKIRHGFVFIVVGIGCASAQAQTNVAEYTFTGNSRASVDLDLNTAASNFIDGGGINSSFVGGAGNPAPAIEIDGQQTDNSEAASINGGSFYEFTVTPAAGQAVIPTAINFNAQAQASGTGGIGLNLGVYWSGDNFATQLGTHSESTGANSTSDFSDLHTINLPGLEAKGQPVTFRAVVWNGSNSPNKHNRFDNVTLSADFLETQSTFTGNATSQDRIVGEAQGSGGPVGYETDTTNGNVGVGGSSGNHFNQNLVLGFELPTLDGPIVSAGLTLTKSGENNPIDVDLYGLGTTNPDGSGISLFLESDTDSNTANTKIADDIFHSIDDNGITRTADVTDFIELLYSGNTPLQTEAFFRLNPDEDLSLGTIERSAFDLNGASLSIITGAAVPEPASVALWAIIGALLLGGAVVRNRQKSHR